VLDDETAEAIENEVEAELDEAVEIAEASPRPDPEELFDRVDDRPSRRMEAQRQWLDSHVAEHGHPEFEY